MGYGIKMFPHLPNGHIVLQFWGTDAVDHSFFLERVVKLVEDDGSNSFILIGWMNTDKIKNNILAVLFGTQQMKDARWKKFSVRFL